MNDIFFIIVFIYTTKQFKTMQQKNTHKYVTKIRNKKGTSTIEIIIK